MFLLYNPDFDSFEEKNFTIPLIIRLCEQKKVETVKLGERIKSQIMLLIFIVK